MIHPRYWIKHAVARRAVRGYPFYDVPHKRDERTLTEADVQENFAYFMRVRLDRLAFFRDWLRVNFKVEASLDGEGLEKVSHWADDYGGGLIGDETYRQGIFKTYEPRWQAAYAGYNVMLDIGIYFGDYLIAKRPKLHWEIYKGDRAEPVTFEADEYLKPCLGGMPRRWKSFPLKTGYGSIANSRDLAIIQHYRAPRDVLVAAARQSLHDSVLPDGNDQIVLGDASNQPL